MEVVKVGSLLYLSFFSSVEDLENEVVLPFKLMEVRRIRGVLTGIEFIPS